VEGVFVRRISQLLFLVFYVASSYAISQERVGLIVSELQRSSSKIDGTHLDAARGQSHDTFPTYRQAKPKAASDAYFGPMELVHLLPHQSERSFHAQTFPLKSLRGIELLLSRAPPPCV
jgi:hypothetical protein